MKTIVKSLFILSTLLFFSSCENSDIANTAAMVEGTYLVSSISAKTGQGQANVQSMTDQDVIILKRTDDLVVDAQFSVSSASVKFGSSQLDYLKTTYQNVNVEGNFENGSYKLLAILNTNNEATLSGSVNSNGLLTLSYRVSGTEFFSITAKKI